MCLYRNFIRPLLFNLEPEQSHYLAHEVIGKWLPVAAHFARKFIYKKTDLQTVVFGKTLSNPIGLAAGFDKNGDLVHALKYLGFGFAEIGSISAQQHDGNAKPRLWRLPSDEGLINWLGLNSAGAIAVAEKLANTDYSLPIGLTIAKTNKPNIDGKAAVEDFLFSFRAIRHLPLLYIALNVSCPNTLDAIAEETALISLAIEEISKENTANLPIFLKLSPDSDDRLIKESVALGKQSSIAGYICGNTSISRAGLKTPGCQNITMGGISGPPLKPLCLALCRKVYALKDSQQIIMGCGGITNGKDAYDYIRAGASLLQLYTALIYEGPSVVKKICEELSALLIKDNLTLAQAVGSDSLSHCK